MGAGRVPSHRLPFYSIPLSRSGISSRTTLVSRHFFTAPPRPVARPKLPQSLPKDRNAPSSVFEGSIVFRYFRSSRFNSSKSSSQKPNPASNSGSPEPAQSLSQRLRKLSREYGWSALGVYMALTALDFPFCFLGVRMLGTDRIGHYEEVVLEAFWKVVHVPFPNLGGKRKGGESTSDNASEDATAREGQLGWSGEVAEAEKTNAGAEASIWTQLVLAYAIHKSFIFIRVPLTAAITPKVVKTLRGWGWNIGKRKPKTG